MSFNNPNALVYEAFSCQSHVHQREVELFCNVAVAASHQAHDALQLGSQESVARARVARHNDGVEVVSDIFSIQKVQIRELNLFLRQVLRALQNLVSVFVIVPVATCLEKRTFNLERYISWSGLSFRLIN